MKLKKYLNESSKLYTELFQIIAISNNKKEITNCINMMNKAKEKKTISDKEYIKLKKEIDEKLKHI